MSPFFLIVFHLMMMMIGIVSAGPANPLHGSHNRVLPPGLKPISIIGLFKTNSLLNFDHQTNLFDKTVCS